ncbi:MAG TPA: hypothetical protein VFX78_11400 [Candidatus Eisenbacteria bacterium]|nr:hypothetical protein [Candidatus Eisenbacteria bacterium]
MDVIEAEYRAWCHAKKVQPYSARAAGFRAGWLAARKRAVEVATAQRDGSGNCIAWEARDKVRAALERLGADEEA